MSDLEQLWKGLLGRNPDMIRAMWQDLTPEEQATVHAHLKRMVSEEGWSEPQRRSAKIALDALADEISGDGGPGAG